MSYWVIVGILTVLALIVGVGLYSGRKVRSARDFLSGGGKAGPLLVCGAILGSLVSSQATIGTAQLAFHYGLAAWWFTLGSGIGCLFLAVGYAARLRRSNCITELQIIAGEYGALAGSLGSILCSIGIFISVLAQVVACVGLVSVLFPRISTVGAATLSIVLMCVYVIFGGAWGAGMGGVIKLLLLCFTSLLGLVYALAACGGPSGLWSQLTALFTATALGAVQPLANDLSALHTAGDVSLRFLNLVARGPAKDIGSGLSLLLGVLSTQTYAQAIWSAKADRAAKQGALLSACLIPPIGIGGICIGLFMRSHYLLAAEVSALEASGAIVPDLPVLAGTIQVFPTFVLDHLPPLVAGIVLGTLLITVVGGGAGLSLGMATILVKDILKRISHRFDAPERELIAVRGAIAVILLTAGCITIFASGSTINDLGFLSMGLRGSVVFLPLTCALWLPGRIDRQGILASMVLSPLTILAAKAAALPIDSLFVGLAVSALFCLAGFFRRQRHMA
ncbi:MAG: sodium:solute symporter family protein [Oscillibacter sp.]|nr:sodium:solute symporter family protein [Oscillibacter sp.]